MNDKSRLLFALNSLTVDALVLYGISDH